MGGVGMGSVGIVVGTPVGYGGGSEVDALVEGVVDGFGVVLGFAVGGAVGATQWETLPVVFSIFPGGQLHFAVVGFGVPPGPQAKFSAARPPRGPSAQIATP